MAFEISKFFLRHNFSKRPKFFVTETSDELWNWGLLLFVDSLSLPKFVERLKLLLVVFWEISEAASSNLKIVKVFILLLCNSSGQELIWFRLVKIKILLVFGERDSDRDLLKIRGFSLVLGVYHLLLINEAMRWVFISSVRVDLRMLFSFGVLIIYHFRGILWVVWCHIYHLRIILIGNKQVLHLEGRWDELVKGVERFLFKRRQGIFIKAPFWLAIAARVEGG